MIEIKSPNRDISSTAGLSIFLGGTIDMGEVDNWQQQMVEKLSNYQGIIFNPRRDDWQPDLPKNTANTIFKEQVEWELDHLQQSDMILLYFYPNTYSPITLLELGLYAASGKLVVCCNEEFWRSGNVQIVCERYGVPVFKTEYELLEYIRSKLEVKDIGWYLNYIDGLPHTKELCHWLVNELTCHNPNSLEYRWLLGLIGRFNSEWYLDELSHVYINNALCDWLITKLYNFESTSETFTRILKMVGSSTIAIHYIALLSNLIDPTNKTHVSVIDAITRNGYW